MISQARMASMRAWMPGWHILSPLSLPISFSMPWELVLNHPTADAQAPRALKCPDYLRNRTVPNRANDACVKYPCRIRLGPIFLTLAEIEPCNACAKPKHAFEGGPENWIKSETCLRDQTCTAIPANELVERLQSDHHLRSTLPHPSTPESPHPKIT